jgi:ribosomal protein S27AE
MPRKLENLLQKSCPRCGSPVMKSWDELSDEQKFLVERLALSGDFSIAERKKHRFCTQCFFEQIQPDLEKV